jgi:hypothetical protein
VTDTTNGFWQGGRFLQGLTVKTGVAFSTTALELEVAKACAKARETGNALSELAALLQQHPALRRDTQNDENHPLNPLVSLFVQQTLSGPDQ